MEPGRSASQLIAESEGLLLDFDGPVCDVYAGSDPARIARDVAAALNLDIETDDPLDLIGSALDGDGPVDAIHQALTETEIAAIGTARETPGVRELIETYTGPIGIVSNNGQEAIEAWLRQAGLSQLVSTVVGRDPRHMKPDPRPLRLAAEHLGLSLDRCVFIGDSVSDAVAAERAGVPLIALINRPEKRQRFNGQRSAATIIGIHELASRSPQPPRAAGIRHQKPQQH